MSGAAQKSDLVDLTLHPHIRTERAVQVSETGDDTRAVWLPTSQIEVEPTKSKSIVTVTLPEWLAVEKGLI